MVEGKEGTFSLVQIMRALLDSENQEKYMNVLWAAGWGGGGVGGWRGAGGKGGREVQVSFVQWYRS